MRGTLAGLHMAHDIVWDEAEQALLAHEHLEGLVSYEAYPL